MEDEPGFKKFILAPYLPSGLDSVSCSYSSPLGKIVSDWKKEGTDRVIYHFIIPAGSAAMVDIQPGHSVKIEIPENNKPPESLMPSGLQTGLFELSGGEYFITVTLPLI